MYILKTVLPEKLVVSISCLIWKLSCLVWAEVEVVLKVSVDVMLAIDAPVFKKWFSSIVTGLSVLPRVVPCALAWPILGLW